MSNGDNSGHYSLSLMVIIVVIHGITVSMIVIMMGPGSKSRSVAEKMLPTSMVYGRYSELVFTFFFFSFFYGLWLIM